MISGTRLRQMRTERLLSQQDLAAAAGLSLATVSNLETERILHPRFSTIRKIAKALEVPEQELA